MKFRNPFKKKCSDCVRYDIRMEHIKRMSRRIDKITKGYTMLGLDETSKVIHLNAMIYIEAMKKDVPLE